jgi:ABC-type multidrug transport system ATPase subunit
MIWVGEFLPNPIFFLHPSVLIRLEFLFYYPYLLYIGEHIYAIKLIDVTKMDDQPTWTNDIQEGRKFRKTAIVDRVSLVLDEGNLLAILGRHGTGKTCCLNMICGLILPTSGEVIIYGKNSRIDPMAIQSMTTLCPQWDILFPELTGREHLELFAAFINLSQTNIRFDQKDRNQPCESEREERKDQQQESMKDDELSSDRQPRPSSSLLIEHQLDALKLTNVADRIVTSYNQGMKRRLTLAICTMIPRKIMIFDEPITSQLDSMSRQIIRDYISQLRGRFDDRRTIVLSTSDPEAIETYADKLIIFGKHRIQMVGSVPELRRRFDSEYRLCLTVDSNQVNPSTIIELVLRQIVDVKLLETTADKLVFRVPSKAILQVTQFLRCYSRRGPSRFGTPKVESRESEFHHSTLSSMSPNTSFSQSIISSSSSPIHSQLYHHHHHRRPSSPTYSFIVPPIRDWSMSSSSFEDLLTSTMMKQT